MPHQNHQDTVFDRIVVWAFSFLVYLYTVVVIFIAVTVQNQFVHHLHVCTINRSVNINSGEKYDLVSKFQGWNSSAFIVLCAVVLACLVVYQKLASPSLTRQQQQNNIVNYTFWVLFVTLLGMAWVMYHVISLANMNCARRDMGAIQYLAQASGAQSMASRATQYVWDYILNK